MILAGGQGARLGVLTKHLAKPAVPFGSRYRIIDFPLSNCTNSGIETVGVLTQYQPLVLNTYIGNGHPWDLDRNNGGTFILPPYQSTSRSDWYKGTANAIYQNIDFIENYDPKYVADPLRRPYLQNGLRQDAASSHIKENADATIAVFEVPWDEASRFGIMNTDEAEPHHRIRGKAEKCRKATWPRWASTFSTGPVLREKLIEDEADASSSHDFGKNIIPGMLADGLKLSAYRFCGYWKDVGTIDSLWEANMDILDRPEEINFRDRNWRIYSKNPVKPAHYIADGAQGRQQRPDRRLQHLRHGRAFGSVQQRDGRKRRHRPRLDPDARA